MSNFTFLTQEQCFGDDKLDVLKKRGTKAVITDFSVLLGGMVSSEHVENDSSLEGRTGYYWTKSDSADYENNTARVVRNSGSIAYFRARARECGARPALPFSEVSSIPTNGESGKRAKDGVLEVEYGYYPQKAVSTDMQEILDAFDVAKHIKGKPVCIIAKTIKGKGVSFMENQVGWHGKAPNEEQYRMAMHELV